MQSDAAVTDLEIQRREASRAISRALGSLSPRQERALRLRFGLAGKGSEPAYYREVAADMGVTTERARQMVLIGMRKICRSEHAQELRGLLHSGVFD
jgi:DNA-directed RNA polymerase sigma subunit (sigma70/sigma32)